MPSEHPGGVFPVRKGGLSPLLKSQKSPKSLRLAVNAMCWQCQGEDADPCVKWRIGNCEVKGCALWPFRPYQGMFGNPVPEALRV